jgi:BirA family biotin operon repressor/biotin-[acetyl-CoA-carboxylase] ligase
MAARDPLDADQLAARLGERWTSLRVVDELDSTNAALQHESAPDRSVLVAEYQTAGRGRFDRVWSSPRGAGLTFSVALRPPVSMPHWGWLPLLAGVALFDAMGDIAPGIGAALKWPNDLLLGPPDVVPQQKAAGVLMQLTGDLVVMGIGLNVSTTRDELPVPGATSLAECGVVVARADVLVAVLERIDRRYAQWCDVDGDADACGLAAAYRERCATIGQDVIVHTAGVPVTGRAVDVDPAGRLVVESGGQLHAVAAGDVEHLRS